MIQGPIEAQEMQWFAVRVKHKHVGGIRKITVGGDFETYKDRAGNVRKRRIKDTGSKVFLPEHLLRRSGFEVFLPVEKEWRRKNRFTPEKHLVAKPKIVGWLFVGWPVGESRWHDLMRLDVVTAVMGTGGRPVSIPEGEIAHLMRVWGGGMLSPKLHQFAKARKVRPGERMRVVAGPLHGQEVRVVDSDGPSVRALLKLLGKDVEVDVRADMLEGLGC